MTGFWKRKEFNLVVFGTYIFLITISKLLEYLSFNFTAFAPVYIFQQVCFLWGILAITRIPTRAFLILSLPLLLFEVFSFSHYILFKIPLTEGGLSSIYNSNFLEWLDYGSGTPIPAFLFGGAILLTFFLSFKFPASKVSLRFIPLLFLPTLITLGLKTIQLKSFSKSYRQVIVQSRPWHSINLIVKSYENLNEFSKMLKDVNLKEYKLKRVDPSLQKHIVIIGESSRRLNWQLYGYERETNPKLKNNKNIFLFSDVVSGSNLTIFSLTEAFYFREDDDISKSPTSNLLYLLKKNNFFTSWISNQQKISQIDSPIGVLATSANESLFVNTDLLSISYDKVLLKPIEEKLSSISKDTVLFIHTMGSHGEYHRRYPKDQSHFKPKDLDSKKDLDIAMYDNTIRYTDSFINDVIKIATKHQVNSVVYFSDHGETVFEDNVPFPTHGNPNFKRREIDIPFFVWLNPSVKNQNLREKLQANKDKPGTLNDLKHFVLSLVGFEGEVIKSNLLDSHYSPKPRIIYGSDKVKKVYSDISN